MAESEPHATNPVPADAHAEVRDDLTPAAGALPASIEAALTVLPSSLRQSLTAPHRRPTDVATVATQLRVRVLQALAAMPAEQQQIMEARERLGRNYAQIATETGRSVSEVESLLLHARWRFRRNIEALCVPSSGESGCDWVLARLAAAVDGELSPAKQAGMAQHVRVCEPCRNALHDLQGTSLLYALAHREDVSAQGEACNEQAEEMTVLDTSAAVPLGKPHVPTLATVKSAIRNAQRQRVALAAAALVLAVGGSMWLAQRLPTEPVQAAARDTLHPTATLPLKTTAPQVEQEQPSPNVAPFEPETPGSTAPRDALTGPDPSTRSMDPTPPTPAAQAFWEPNGTVIPEELEVGSLGAGDEAVVRGEDDEQGNWLLVPSVPLNLRAQPWSQAERLEVLAAGQPVRLYGGPILTEEADFYFVGLPGGLRGWVSPPPGDIPGPARDAWAEKRQLRSLPGSEADATTLKVGTLVRVLEVTRTAEHGMWARVRVLALGGNGPEGYLPANALASVKLP